MGVLSQMLETLLSFVDVRTSASAEAFTVEADENEDGTVDEYSTSEGFEHAAILHRPVDGDDAGKMEAVAWRYGDQMIVIGSKERRWTIELDKGDVVLRSYGEPDTAAFVHLKPDGTVLIRGAEIRLEESDGAATESIALGNAVKTWIDAMDTLFRSSWIAVPNDGGAALKTAFTAAFPSPPGDFASSKHKVEP